MLLFAWSVCQFIGTVVVAYGILAVTVPFLQAALGRWDSPKCSQPTLPPTDESLDEVFARLKRAAGPNFIDPVRESRLMEMRDPTIHQPTDESRAAYVAFVKAEARARARRIRRERWQALKAHLRVVIRAISSYINSIGN